MQQYIFDVREGKVMENNNIPLLSVCIITYNHAKYIRQAVESVLMQKVNFSWELVIADDFSTDGTREIIIDYQKQYPSFIRLILQENNVGPGENWIQLVTFPKSKYIAYFEGDDYWTDPHKLQKQLDILESNDKYSACVHRVKVIGEKNIENDSLNKFLPQVEPHKSFYDLKDLLIHKRGLQFHSSSFFYRKNCFDIEEFIKITDGLSFGDVPLLMMLTKHGTIYYIPEVMSCYRKHQQSLTSGGDPRKKLLFGSSAMTLYERLKPYFNHKYDKYLNEAIYKFFLPRADRYYELKDSKNVRKNIIKALIFDTYNTIVLNFRMCIVLLAYSICPFVFKK